MTHLANKLLHIGLDSTLMRDFIDLVHEIDPTNDHHFLIWQKNKSVITPKNNVWIRSYSGFKQLLNPLFFWSLFKQFKTANRIILHGLNEIITLLCILLVPKSTMREIIWFYWGAELHKYKKTTLGLKLKIMLSIQSLALKKIDFIAVGMESEYRDIINFFNLDIPPIWTFKYPSNIIRLGTNSISKTSSLIQENKLNIMVGHSADKSNDHQTIFTKLHGQLLSTDDYSIYAPLSYGINNDVDAIIKIGNSLFSERFIPITSLLSLEDYRSFLSAINVAFFCQKRQQGMGNITYLLANGATVYLDSEANHAQYFREKGVVFRSIHEMDLVQITKEQSNDNRRIMAELFSEKKLHSQLLEIFNK